MSHETGLAWAAFGGMTSEQAEVSAIAAAQTGPDPEQGKQQLRVIRSGVPRSGPQIIEESGGPDVLEAESETMFLICSSDGPFAPRRRSREATAWNSNS